MDAAIASPLESRSGNPDPNGLMVTQVMSGCAIDKKNASSTAAQAFAGEAEVITGTGALHKQKDSPVETERVNRKLLEKAAETHTRQVLQDVPAILPRR